VNYVCVKPRDGIVRLPLRMSGAWKLESLKGKNGLSYGLERRRKQQLLKRQNNSYSS
jgi:hypothetical protein